MQAYIKLEDQTHSKDQSQDQNQQNPSIQLAPSAEKGKTEYSKHTLNEH